MTTRQAAKLKEPTKYDSTEDELPRILKRDIAISQRDDPILSRVIFYVTNNRKPDTLDRKREPHECQLYFRQWDRLCLCYDILHRSRTSVDGKVSYQLVLPKKYRVLAIQGLHDDIGHMGFDKTLDLVRNRFFWPKMAQDIKQWCVECKRCCLWKTQLTRTRVPLVTITTSEPLELVCIDFLKLERSKGGLENIRIITDHFTKYAQAFATLDQKADTVPKTLCKNFFQHYRFPLCLHSDQGRHFESELIKEFCKVSGIKQTHTRPYHPQGNGQTERFNHTLLNMLGSMEPNIKRNWKEYDGQMAHAYNAT